MAENNDALKRQVDQALHGENAILESCRRFLEVISPTVDAICEQVEIQPPNRSLVSRCIIKRAQENLEMIIFTAESAQPYMGTMPLRPLCEDLIYGTWLRSLPEEDADKFIMLSTIDDILKSVSAQNSFLPQAYADLGALPDGGTPLPRLPNIKPVVVAANAGGNEQGLAHKRELKALGLKLGWPKGKPPSIYAMSRQAGLGDLYDFFYHGSSKAVHSSLHNMARMVWTKKGMKGYTISSHNFEGYYRVFSLAYGLWLVSEIIERIAMVEFPEESRLIDKQAYSVWLAMPLVGLARNGDLPPLVTVEELRWPTSTTATVCDFSRRGFVICYA
jgi:hypothetical protein